MRNRVYTAIKMNVEHLLDHYNEVEGIYTIYTNQKGFKNQMEHMIIEINQIKKYNRKELEFIEECLHHEDFLNNGNVPKSEIIYSSLYWYVIRLLNNSIKIKL